MRFLGDGLSSTVTYLYAFHYGNDDGDEPSDSEEQPRCRVEQLARNRRALHTQACLPCHAEDEQSIAQVDRASTN